MEVLLHAGEAGVAEVRDQIHQAPGYDGVRTTLRILEEKGLVAHREAGRRYVYRPTLNPARAREAALTHLVGTFFGGSPERAVLALLRRSDLELTGEELRKLERRIEELEG